MNKTLRNDRLTSPFLAVGLDTGRAPLIPGTILCFQPSDSTVGKYFLQTLGLEPSCYGKALDRKSRYEDTQKLWYLLRAPTLKMCDLGLPTLTRRHVLTQDLYNARQAVDANLTVEASE